MVWMFAVCGVEIISSLGFLFFVAAGADDVVDETVNVWTLSLIATTLCLSIGLDLAREYWSERAAVQVKIAIVEARIHRTPATEPVDVADVVGIRGAGAEAAVLAIGRQTKRHGVGLAGVIAVWVAAGLVSASVVLATRYLAKWLFWRLTISGVMGRSAGVALEPRRLNYLGKMPLDPALHRELRVNSAFDRIRQLYDSTWQRAATLAKPTLFAQLGVTVVGLALVASDIVIVLRHQDDITATSAAGSAFSISLLLLGLITSLGISLVGQYDYFLEYGTISFSGVRGGAVVRPGGWTPAEWERVGLTEVSVHYPNRRQPTLRRVNLEISSDEIVAVTGSSGSGKSTLLRVIIGIQSPTAGIVDVDGKGEVSRSLVSMFESPARLPIDLRENIGLGDLSGDEAGWLLSNFPLADRLRQELELAPERGPVQLSGGEWQQVAICRAAIFSRRYGLPMAFDEPASSLDAIRLERLIAAVVSDARVRGVGCVFITHRQALVALADRQVVVGGGGIVEHAPTNSRDVAR